MKQILMYLTIFLIPLLLVGHLFARPSPPQNPEVKLVEPAPLLTEKQVINLIEQQTETVGQNKVITLDEVYADYKDDLLITVIAIDDYLEPRENNVFRKDDYAFFIKANTAYILSQKNNAGAVMIGIAILNSREVVNILIAEGKVIIYDIEGHSFRTPKEYIIAGFKFALIII